MSVDVSTTTDATRVADIARALSDPIRVRILDALRSGCCNERCQCELQPMFEISQPTMSHHMRRLREAGLIEVERRGRWAYYSVRPEVLEELKSWLS